MTDPCRWCGETHLKGVCPKVKAIEFYEMGDGTAIKRVEFMTPRDCMPANGWQLTVPSVLSPGHVAPQPWQPRNPWSTISISNDSQTRLENQSRSNVQ